MMGRKSQQLQIIFLDMEQMIPKNHLIEKGNKKRHSSSKRRVPPFSISPKFKKDGESHSIKEAILL